MGDGRLLIPLVCWLLTSVFFAMIVVTTVKVFQMSTLSAFQEQWNWLVTAVLCIAAAVEIIIASSMCYYLNIWKKELIASRYGAYLYLISVHLLTIDVVHSTITILRDVMTWAIGTVLRFIKPWLPWYNSDFHLICYRNRNSHQCQRPDYGCMCESLFGCLAHTLWETHLNIVRDHAQKL
jgi:hypothetical protein